MAVAVKNAPDKTSWSPFHRLPTASLAAAIYLVVCLGIVFKLVPTLWWAHTEALTNEFVSVALLGLVMIGVGVALGFVGVKTFATRELPGLRAGIFVALVFLLFTALFARWFGGMLENWVYNGNWFGATGPFVGAVIAGAIALLLLVLVIRLFHRPGFAKFLVRLEGQGWFSATTFKRGQGLRVRRGTTVAILVVGLCGIWVLDNHGTLKKSAADWGLNIPFTGTVPLDPPGDAEQLIQTDSEIRMRSWVVVTERGASSFKEGQRVSRDAFDDEVRRIVKETAEKAESKLAETDLNNDKFDLKAAIEQLKKNKVALSLPTGVIVVDRFTLRDINARLPQFPRNDSTEFAKLPEDAYVKVAKAEVLPNATLKEGQVVTKREFREERERLAADGVSKDQLPEVKPATPLDLTPTYASVTLLPAARYTIPLLLFALTLWLGWRIVNMPVFADFLIATEAELNKVSWTTRKRLVQDTIVVLVTMVLMVVFLFVVDVAWGRILSWHPIGVLQVSDQKQESENLAEPKW